MVSAVHRGRNRMTESLTPYSDQELSLRVFNDEGLYDERHTAGLFDLLSEIFTFTDAQRRELVWDLEIDLEEIGTA